MEHISTFSTYLSRKIPHVPLAVHFAIVHFVFPQCTTNARSIFWGYYPILCTFVLIWEGISSYAHFRTVYRGKNRGEMILFAILNSFMSVFAFISLTFFLQDGRPMSCIFAYNRDIAFVVFAMCVASIAILTYFEHFWWGDVIRGGDLISL